jgi:hypothetical protein
MMDDLLASPSTDEDLTIFTPTDDYPLLELPDGKDDLRQVLLNRFYNFKFISTVG